MLLRKEGPGEGNTGGVSGNEAHVRGTGTGNTSWETSWQLTRSTPFSPGRPLRKAPDARSRRLTSHSTRSSLFRGSQGSGCRSPTARNRRGAGQRVISGCTLPAVANQQPSPGTCRRAAPSPAGAEAVTQDQDTRCPASGLRTGEPAAPGQRGRREATALGPHRLPDGHRARGAAYPQSRHPSGASDLPRGPERGALKPHPSPLVSAADCPPTPSFPSCASGAICSASRTPHVRAEKAG